MRKVQNEGGLKEKAIDIFPAKGYSSPRQYFKCLGLQSFRGRAPTDLTVLKKLPPSQPSWPRAGGNKHIFGGLCRRNLSNKGLFFCDQI